ncbi:MAG: hypothetical protein HY043_13615 [Verrucomicrobia bacterium]|nr:hypothetical protein [Verrucomicrobiota bacterium]
MNNLFDIFAAFCFASGVSVSFSIIGLLNMISPIPIQPKCISNEVWEDLINDRKEKSGAGWVIGLLECWLSLAAFWVQPDGYPILAGWLTFKIASKWEAWKNIVQVPNRLRRVNDAEWYAARSRLGSWILTRFQIGTLLNILIGFVSAYIGAHATSFFSWLCS